MAVQDNHTILDFQVRSSMLSCFNLGCSIPLVMFVVWNGAILGSLNTLARNGKSDPLELLSQQSPSVGILIQVHHALFHDVYNLN